MVVIANAQTYGTGAIINPKGVLDDGLFEVVVIRRLSVLELFKMLVSHKPFDPDKVEIFQTKNVEMNVQRKTYFQVDGEYLGKATTVKARILPQVIHVMLPGEVSNM